MKSVVPSSYCIICISKNLHQLPLLNIFIHIYSDTVYLLTVTLNIFTGNISWISVTRGKTQGRYVTVDIYEEA